MKRQQTPNGIDYSVNTMKQGDVITLAPVKGKHTQEQVREARRWLYSQHTVIAGGLLIEWISMTVRILNPAQ